LAWHNALLWFGPPALLIGGALVLLVSAWRRKRAGPLPAGPEAQALTAAEEARLAALMQGGER
jgi:cytochrome c-type biogenesis protein CcmH/NrfF